MRRTTTSIAAAIALTVMAGSAAAQTATVGNISVEYETAGPDTEAIRSQLMQRRTLERVAQFLAPLKLPRPLTLRMRDCRWDGIYDSGVVSVCYDAVKRFAAQSAAATPQPGVTRDRMLIGATLDLFLHETAHAVFEMLQVPVFGREEDAADQFAAYTILQFPKAEARQFILGVTLILSKEDEEDQQKPINRHARYGGQHSVPAQRYYNYLCLAYGSDAELFATEGALLPPWRARQCGTEYAQVKRAYERLVMPHIDGDALARLRQQGPLLDNAE